jgi:hypothetical protein
MGSRCGRKRPHLLPIPSQTKNIICHVERSETSFLVNQFTKYFLKTLVFLKVIFEI